MCHVGTVIGLDDGLANEGESLQKQFRVTSEVQQYEANQRHRKNHLRVLGLENCRGVATPGVKHRDDTDGEPLDRATQKLCRTAAGFAQYLAGDRFDCSTSRKRSCGVWRNLSKARLRLASDLDDASEATIATLINANGCSTMKTCLTSSKFPGCTRTAQSTTSIVVQRNGNNLAEFSVTQDCGALSTAESELNAAVKGSIEGISCRNMLRFMGINNTTLRLRPDSSVVVAELCRLDTRKRLRHFHSQYLLLQQLVKEKELAHCH